MFGYQTPVIVVGGTAVAYVMLLVLSLRRRGLKTWPQGLFSLYLLLGIAWALSKSVTIMQGLIPEVPFYGNWIATDLMIVLPVLLAILTLLFFDRAGASWVGLIGAVWVALALLVNSNVGGIKDWVQEGLRLSTPAEAASIVLVIGWAGFTGGALVLAVWDYVRIQRPLHRNRILYWLGAILLIGAGEGLTIAPGETMAQVGAFVRMLGALVMSYAMLSYYLPNVRSVIRQAASATLITLVTAGLFLLSFLLLQSLLRSPLLAGYALAGAAIMSVLLSIVIQPVRRAATDLVERFLFGEGYDPARALRDYSAAITNILDLDMLVTMAIGIISEVLEIRRGTLLLMTEREDGHIEVRIIPGMGEVSVKTAEFDPNSPILAHLNQTGQPLSQYEIDILPEFRTSPPWERAWLEELNMELYVPIRRQSLLVGILALGGKAGEAPYSDQDLNMLSTLTGQTAVALQNARLVSDLKALNADITSLNDELTHTNRRLEKLDEAKTNFIQIASHELRTPLTQVRGYADIMADVVQSGEPSPAQLAQVSQGISRATVRLEEIISAMLDVSQIDVESLSLNRTLLAMTTVMRIALDNYRTALEQRKQTLSIEGLEGLPPIQGDLQRLCQAFGNIIGNCIKYTPDGGRIAINGRHFQEAGVGGTPITYVEITVADTGIGIDAEDRELIFEKFYRVGSPDLHSTGSTKFKGAGPGLGLPISRGVIKAHGGRVWVESPGHDEVNLPGSTFHVVLPSTPPAPAAGVIAASAVTTALAS
jgi:signal transduction histidine kinase